MNDYKKMWGEFKNLLEPNPEDLYICNGNGEFMFDDDILSIMEELEEKYLDSGGKK